jgi:hypothetical protein
MSFSTVSVRSHYYSSDACRPMIWSIASFISIETGFLEYCLPSKQRREPTRSVTGDENYRSLPSLQEVRDRINAIAVDADVEDREVELGYHRKSTRIASGGSRNDAMTEFLKHARYGFADLGMSSSIRLLHTGQGSPGA